MKLWLSLWLVLMVCVGNLLAQAELTYEVGGPLEGPMLKPMPVQHGEKPGFPGCIPQLAAQTAGQATVDDNPAWGMFTPQGQWGQMQLYPGSVEHYRAYWQKYVPVRAMFDAGSLLKVWIAPNIPSQGQAKVEAYAAPVYWVPRFRPATATELFDKSVPVIRAGIKTPVFNLDLGELRDGMYVLRVVGAVPSANLGPVNAKKERLRTPIYLSMTVNDGLQGQTSTYRMRAGCVDEFYSVAEFYFHAPVRRAYQATLQVDEGSKTELLVQCIDLHDVLAGTVRRAIKQRMTFTSPQQRELIRQQVAGKARGAKAPADSIADMAKRLESDAVAWESLPGPNAQVGGVYGLNRGYGSAVSFGANDKTMAELDEQFGAWEVPARYHSGLDRVLMVNKKLNLQYTMADLAAHKPLPDPYPIKDTGTGVVTANPDNAAAPQQDFTVIADMVSARHNPYFQTLKRNAQRYHETGDMEAGWTAAVQLVRTAYLFPSIDGSLSLDAVASDPGGFERDLRCRRRAAELFVGGGNGFGDSDLLDAYDQLFDLIKGNKELAQSIGRFVPWVKTPEDVVQLVDVYLVQYMAKRILRYNYLYDNHPTWLTEPATILADRSVTDPWLKWLFTKAYVYPNPPSGLGEMVTTANDRDGIGYIASWSYGMGEQAAKNGIAMQAYIKAGGNPEYDLTDPRKYPKVTEALYWMAFRCRLAGLHFPRIGDVAGPDKGYGYLFDASIKVASEGWRWTKDPAFAWIIEHFIGRQGETDEEWTAIRKASTTQKRAPWLDQRSRVSINWFGVLESGTSQDDYRFRRSVMLRLGQGYGHQHDDTLDMQITAHGLPMTIDGGQRPGYSKPIDRITRLHNVVEVDEKDWRGHSWVRTLTDAPGARYMQAEATPPASHENVKFHRRQVAMIDVDEGKGAQQMSLAQLKPDAKLNTGPELVTPNSYVVDVVRVSGGKVHTYCFHGPLEDELVTNVQDQKPYELLTAAPAPAAGQAVDSVQQYVSVFRNLTEEGYPMQPLHWSGSAPDTLLATWRMAIEIPGTGFGEKEMAPGIYDPSNPRKFTRLHLLGQKGAKVMTGWAWCRQWKYGYNNLYTQQRSPQDRDYVFPAIIEPYAGQPFISAASLVNIPGNSDDAAKAVALEIKTVNGHRDLVFTDGKPEQVRQVAGYTVAGEFAYVSNDAQGLRAASLTGGTELSGPDVLLKPASRERLAKVTASDYAQRQFTVDQVWPAGATLKSRSLEIGTPGRMTTLTLQSATSKDGATVLSTQGGAQFYLSKIRKFDAAKQTVYCQLGLPQQAGAVCPGLDKNWVASNGAGTKFWRAEYLGRTSQEGDYAFRLDGPVTQADLGDLQEAMFRLWEYGVGDTARMSTFANLRRTTTGGAGVYELTADVDLTVALPGMSIELSSDGQTYTTLKSVAKGKLVEATIRLADLAGQDKVYLRVK